MLTPLQRPAFAGIHESNYIPVQSDEVIEINAVLTAAEPNPNLDPNLDAQWPTFRANRFNNGVVDYPIPTIANDSVLYWATQFGSGYGSNACSCPIIVDDFLYVYAGTQHEEGYGDEPDDHVPGSEHLRTHHHPYHHPRLPILISASLRIFGCPLPVISGR